MTKADATQSTPAEETTVKKQKAPRPSTKGKEPPRKRGPPRPHRKLAQEILEGRIAKLQKRITRAKDQLEDAHRHIEGYQKEAGYREQDAKKND